MMNKTKDINEIANKLSFHFNLNYQYYDDEYHIQAIGDTKIIDENIEKRLKDIELKEFKISAFTLFFDEQYNNQGDLEFEFDSKVKCYFNRRIILRTFIILQNIYSNFNQKLNLFIYRRKNSHKIEVMILGCKFRDFSYIIAHKVNEVNDELELGEEEESEEHIIDLEEE